MAKTIKVEMIEQDALINIQIPGTIYQRIQQLLTSYAGIRTPAEIAKAALNLKEGKDPADEWEYHFQTLVLVLSEIEKKAKAQGQTKEKEIELPDAPVAPPSS